MRRALAALGTGGILALALIGSRGQPDGESPPRPGKLPPAIGAIHPRLSPDGASVAFSYQGGIWVAPRGGGTAILLSTGEGEDTEPAWSPDGKRVAFVRGAAVAFLAWIDKFELLLRTRDRFPTPRHRQQAQEQLEAARRVYARIIRDAGE